MILDRCPTCATDARMTPACQTLFEWWRLLPDAAARFSMRPPTRPEPIVTAPVTRRAADS